MSRCVFPVFMFCILEHVESILSCSFLENSEMKESFRRGIIIYYDDFIVIYS